MSSHPHRRLLAVALPAAAILLSACGGSSTVRSDSSSPGSVNPPTVFANAANPTLAESVGTSFPLRGNTLSVSGAAGATTATTLAAAAAARTRTSATEATLDFTADGQTRRATLDLTRPLTVPGGLGVPVFEATLSDGVLTTADTNAGILNYASFGYWAFRRNVTPTPATSVQTYFMGRETPLGAMRITGSATYNGTTLGYGAISGAEVFITGNVLLTATFTIGGGSIGGQINTISALPVSAPLPGSAVLPTRIDLSAGSISGNTFAGSTTALSGVGGTVVGSGSFDGRFYGPDVDEVAGRWAVESSSDPAASLRLIGSFGARR